MAGIPMYYGIPTFEEVEGQMAENKLKVLKTQEAQIEMDELMQAKDILKKQAIDELTKSKTPAVPPVMPGSYTNQPMVQGTGLDGRPAQMPPGAISLQNNQPVPTGFATDPTTDVNPTSPFGTYEQSGAQSPADMPYGFGGAIPKDYKSQDEVVQDQTETPAQQGQQQDQVAADSSIQGYQGDQQTRQEQPPVNQPRTIVQEAKYATQEFKSANDQVESAYKTAELFKQKGLLLQYQKQLKVAGDLENVRTMAAERRATTAAKVMEVTGQIAQGYLDSVKADPSPANRQRAWQMASLELQKNVGIPATSLLNIPDAQRDKFAEQYADQAISGSKKLKMEAEALKEKGRNERFEKTLNERKDYHADKNRWEADKKDLNERKFSATQFKDFSANSHKIIGELKNDLKVTQDKFDKLRKGDYILDESGQLMDEESRGKEAKILSDHIENLQSKIKLEEEKIQTYSNYMTPKDLKETQSQASKELISKDDIGQVVQAINTYPDQFPKIKANFEKLHPGLKIEDFVKLNPNKVKTK
jgi:hypothetical protein